MVLDVEGAAYRMRSLRRIRLCHFVRPRGADPVVMLFTSGTSGTRRPCGSPTRWRCCVGASWPERFELTADDARYLSMPLSINGVAAGWAVAIACGATIVPKVLTVAVPVDIRRYGATYMNYVGKPLALVLATAEAAPTTPTTRCGSVRQRGHRARHRRFRETIRLPVVDSFGSSEFAVVVMREDGTPPGSIGRGYPGVSVYRADTVSDCAPAVSTSTVR